MDKIKPVACLCETALGSRYWTTSEPLFDIPLGAYYDQSAIDALRADLEREQGVREDAQRQLREALPDAERWRALVWLKDSDVGEFINLTTIGDLEDIDRHVAKMRRREHGGLPMRRGP